MSHRGGKIQANWRKVTKTATAPLQHPAPLTGPVLLSITQSELDIALSPDSHFAGIEDCRYAASYSWLDGKVSTIVVPGKLHFQVFSALVSVHAFLTTS